MQRYFAEIVDNKVVLSKEDEHHISHVMRNKVGDEIEVVFDSSLYLCKIVSFDPKPNVEVVEKIPTNGKETKNITLFFALAKGDKNDLVIQKATEIGVKNIVLVETKRCVAKFSDGDKQAHKFDRYTKIMKEASEQSRRLDIPNIYGVYKLNKIPEELLPENRFVAYEKEAGNTDSFYASLAALDASTSIGIVIGPEGGFDKEEIEYLNSIGFKNASLGTTILRTETAAIYAMSVISFILGR